MSDQEEDNFFDVQSEPDVREPVAEAAPKLGTPEVEGDVVDVVDLTHEVEGTWTLLWLRPWLGPS